MRFFACCKITFNTNIFLRQSLVGKAIINIILCTKAKEKHRADGKQRLSRAELGWELT